MQNNLPDVRELLNEVTRAREIYDSLNRSEAAHAVEKTVEFYGEINFTPKGLYSQDWADHRKGALMDALEDEQMPVRTELSAFSYITRLRWDAENEIVLVSGIAVGDGGGTATFTDEPYDYVDGTEQVLRFIIDNAPVEE